MDCKQYNKNELIQEALLILRGKAASPESILELSKRLKHFNAFNYARRVLTLACKEPIADKKLELELEQQRALCTYRDQDLPIVDRLDQAIEILKTGLPDLDNSNDPETLAIAGAIYKRKWEVNGEKQYLERSHAYYLKGYNNGDNSYLCYIGINAAFIADVLAQQEYKEAAKTRTGADKADFYKNQALKIREEIITRLPELKKQDTKEDWSEKYWYLLTMAEAYFGLKQYGEARPYLKKAMELDCVEDWEIENTTRQLAQLALLNEPTNAVGMEEGAAWNVLKELTGGNTAALRASFSGKVGLALSGGGFRASLYHIGVLAKLAELDMLRNVEVLSCVSGGSIIGAHYYLEIRNLLQTKKDAEITSQHYVEIIDRISRDFLLGVQKNIRTRVAANWFDNFKMLISKSYSRTVKVGELYEKELFSKVKDGEENKERWLNDLFVHPLKENGEKDTSFNPKYDNWRRQAKIPILILNATTLNTGHNWQFTASWMGESPSSIQKIDGNYRLRRMYYKTEGEETTQRKVRLGQAVAASSCVPGLFEPQTLSNLYEKDITVKLVDGGVHDNQGLCGLFEQDCSVLLVSDASGQMSTEKEPGISVLGVSMRANDILMERVRNAQFQDMENRFRAGTLKGRMFIHLKLDLDVETVDWINCEDPSDETLFGKNKMQLTSYGIRKDLQRHLAAIRTDLDTFNDTEALALMYSGYAMTNAEFNKGISGFTGSPVKNFSWNFFCMREELSKPDVSEQLVSLLKVGKEKFFKVWKLYTGLKILGIALLVVCFAGIVAAIAYWYHQPIATVGKVGWMLFWFVVGLFVSKKVIKVIRYKSTLLNFFAGVGVITLGCIAANLQVHVLDKLYIRKGKRAGK
jgi:predicted acylesterase/phospholipase RssA